MTRRTPYTERGIVRVPCCRCGKPSCYQWTICADGNQWRGLCAECDVALNALVMRFVWGDTRETVIDAYSLKVLGHV